MFDFTCSRRQLIKYLSGGALVLLGLKGRSSLAATNVDFTRLIPTATFPKNRIVFCRHEQALDEKGMPRQEIARVMVEESLKILTQKSNLSEAWQTFVTPSDIIGLKVNSMTYPTTHTALTYAVTDSLINAGIKENNLIIWDQIGENLQRAGYQLNESAQGIRCYGGNSFGNILTTNIRRLRYDFTAVSFASASSRLSKIFSQHCTAVINLPILKDHYVAGITGTMKSMLGGVNYPEYYHPNNGNPRLADLNGIPQINQKIKLNILDVLKPLYQGGPHGQPNKQWPAKAIMVGTDRVAMDYLGWQIIEKKRAEMGLKSLAAEHRQPAYILTAAQKGLGIADITKIELIELNL